MKRIIKIVMALALACVMVLPFTACEKIVKLNINMDLYNIKNEANENVTLTFKLYQNLAPNAVKAIKGYVKDGLYENSIIYKQSKYGDQTTASQLMYGGYNMKDGVITKNASKVIANADFTKNGTIGSNLTNQLGYIGLWRDWDTTKGFKADGFEKTNTTMFMPTSDLAASYDGYFCVMGKYEAEKDLEILNNLISVSANTDYYTNYTCYYLADSTGKLVKDTDGNAVWQVVTTEVFDEFGDEAKKLVYEVSKDPDHKNDKKKDVQYESYKLSVINSAKLKIKSVTIK